MLNIDGRSRVPIYEQIKNQLMELIRLEVYSPHDKLPSIRALAADAGLNVNTVKRAMLDLEADGVVYSLPGRGSFVSEDALGSASVRKKAFAELSGAIRAARSKGVTLEDITALAHGIYDEKSIESEDNDNG